MSFVFSWPQFSESFYHHATELLENALNKGEKPAIIADRILVKELDMGTLPPDLEVLEIGDLTKDRFRGIFRLSYSGDAHIELQTNVQINPLSHAKPGLDILPSPSVLFASAPLIVPMRLRLSSLHLRAIMVLVVSRQKGITLVFKNDPLESVQVSSSFDSVAVIQGYIQREIEGQLREMFRNDLPGIIHKLSTKWLSESNTPAAPLRSGFDYPSHRQTFGPASSTGSTPMSASASSESHLSMPSRVRPRIIKSPSEMSALSVADDIENYDPTYGMRPESQEYKRVGNDQLCKSPGEALVPDADEDGWEVPTSPALSETHWSDHDGYIRSMQGLDYEILPAVGGGFIQRPRQIPPDRRHSSASNYDHPTPLAVNRPMYSRTNTADVERLWDQETPSINRRPYINTISSQSVPSLASSPLSRSLSTGSPSSQASRSSSLFFQPTQASSYSSLASSRANSPLTPVSERPSPSRKPSPPPFLDRTTTALPDLYNTDEIEQPGITLNPKAEISAHLASLVNNYQTFSPFTRSFDQTVQRSFPGPIAKGKKEAGIPVKGRQKRVHRFGAAAGVEAKSVGGTPMSRSDDGQSSSMSYFPRRPIRPGFRQTHSEYLG